MFNFSTMTDFLTEIAGSALQGDAEVPSGLQELMQNAGLDPSALAGLSESEIMSLLSEYGIDPSQFAAADVQVLMADYGLGDALQKSQR